MADVSKYFAQGQFDSASVLRDWEWALEGRTFEVHRVTSLGDAFLLDAKGVVYFLDTMEGEVFEFASGVEELKVLLQDRNVRKKYLASFLIRDLVSAGMLLEAGECYSPDVPLVLGGKLDQSNLRPTKVETHISLMGQIHRQVRELPPGTPISRIVVE